ncbi:MAG: class I SAM-dependent methyltransferase [Bacteroidota bacterium]
MISFDRIAPVYDKLALGVFGTSIREIQTDLLPLIPANAEVLIVGGGSGWIVEEIFEHGKINRLVFLEASREMLKLAVARESPPALSIESASKIEWVFSQHFDLLPTDRFQVIIAPFFFDLFPQKGLSNIVKQLDTHLCQGGIWIFADFTLPKGILRPVAKFTLWLMYSFFNWTSGLKNHALPNIPIIFEEMGYNLIQESKRFFTFMVAQAYEKS